MAAPAVEQLGLASPGAPRDRTQPERCMAHWMVRTGGWLVDAAVEARMRQALTERDATLPNPKGPPVQNPTARWVFPDGVGRHVRLIPSSVRNAG